MHKWMRKGCWGLWKRSCMQNSRAYEEALANPKAAQQSHLQSILAEAEGSQWARTHGLSGKSSVDDFRDRAPILEPSDLSRWTDRILSGERDVLTRQKIERLVPTSGTTGASKLIPMTPGSRREYAIAVNLWLHDCLTRCPSIMDGTAYIATSPAVDPTVESGGIPVGFAQDEAYLGLIERRVLKSILAVPGNVARLRGEAWRQATRKHLEQAIDLSFISIWHPSYMEALFTERELQNLNKKWSRLSLISTWSDGACAQAARRLKASFPKAVFQPKGLWLTEGAVTIPRGCFSPLALQSGFFEFDPGDESQLRLAHELEEGAVYRPVLTNHSGLYRYRLGDLIQVEAFAAKTPCLRWLGRADKVSDLCGEKLNEAQITDALKNIGWNADFLIVPIREPGRQYYLCVVDTEKDIFPIKELDSELRGNPHYEWARELGQLLEPKVCPAKTENIRMLNCREKETYLCLHSDEQLLSEIRRLHKQHA